MNLSSTAFEDGDLIPALYTCDGDEGITNPPLAWSDVPSEAASLALVMEDPDAPKLFSDEPFVHWILFDMPPASRSVPESSTVGTLGANSRGDAAYIGPCPPPNREPAEHRYIFTLYALDTTLGLPAGATRAKVLAALEGHILAQATLTGRYRRR